MPKYLRPYFCNLTDVLEGYHKFECGVPDIYGRILAKVTELSQGKMDPGDTNGYSRLALRVNLDLNMSSIW